MINPSMINPPNHVQCYWCGREDRPLRYMTDEGMTLICDECHPDWQKTLEGRLYALREAWADFKHTVLTLLNDAIFNRRHKL